MDANQLASIVDLTTDTPVAETASQNRPGEAALLSESLVATPASPFGSINTPTKEFSDRVLPPDSPFVAVPSVLSP